jgi:hypothetical protein
LVESRDPHLAGGEKTTNGNFQVINSQWINHPKIIGGEFSYQTNPTYPWFDTKDIS